MSFRVWMLAVPGILAVLVGCGGSAPPVAAPTANVLPLPGAAAPLDGFPRERVALYDNQREAMVLPGGATRIDLEVGAGAAVLRFSVLPSEVGAPVAASVYQAGQGAALPPATDPAVWAQRSVPVTPGVAASLVLSSEKPFRLAACVVVPDAPARPDVFVYLIDTLRQDHLSAYNYRLETSPALEAFVKDATLFRDLTPMSSWTRPSVTSLLTGTMDYTHHVFGAQDRVRAGLPSLAKTLEAAGWETRALMTNPAVSSSFGTGVNFQWHKDLWQGQNPLSWPVDVLAMDHALDAIANAHGQPLFLYIHTMAPHRDYTPHPDHVDRFMPEKFVGTIHQVRVMKDLANYDAEIRFSDDQFGRFVQGLKDAGRYDNALIVLLSDHGEQFMEHGKMAHAESLQFGEMAVPFIVKLPKNVRVDKPVRTTVQMADIAPTILDALGLAVPSAMEGRSLLPLIWHDKPFPPQPAFARLRFADRHLYMAQTETVKYIHDVVRGESTWYQRVEDPDEYFPLRQPPEGGAELKAFADAIAARPVPAEGEGSAPLTPQESEDLKALGYL